MHTRDAVFQPRSVPASVAGGHDAAVAKCGIDVGSGRRCRHRRRPGHDLQVWPAFGVGIRERGLNSHRKAANIVAVLGRQLCQHENGAKRFRQNFRVAIIDTDLGGACFFCMLLQAADSLYIQIVKACTPAVQPPRRFAPNASPQARCVVADGTVEGGGREFAASAVLPTRRNRRNIVDQSLKS